MPGRGFHEGLTRIALHADMKYLLLAAMRGDILAQTKLRDPEVRRQTLQSAAEHYTRCSKVARLCIFGSKAFLHACVHDWHVHAA